VFGSTFDSGGVAFSDAGSISNNTGVSGAALAGAAVPSEYLANDTEFSSATNSIQHSVQLIGGMGAKAPVFASVTGGVPDITTFNGTGSLTAYSGSTVVGQRSVMDDATQRRRLRNAVEQSPPAAKFILVHAALVRAFLDHCTRNRG